MNGIYILNEWYILQINVIKLIIICSCMNVLMQIIGTDETFERIKNNNIYILKKVNSFKIKINYIIYKYKYNIN